MFAGADATYTIQIATDVLRIVDSSGAAEENREGRFKTNKLTLTNCRTWKAGKYAKMSCAKTKSTIYGWLVALFETKNMQFARW